MKNKVLIISFLFFSYTTIEAQEVKVSMWSNNYLTVNSYNGTISPNSVNFFFEGNGNINLPNWKLSVKLKQPIKSGVHTFPANKVIFQPSATETSAGSTIPAIAEIGMPFRVNLQENQEVFLVPQSQSALKNTSSTSGQYFNMILKYNLIIEGGAYLANYPSWTTFPIPLQLTAYDERNKVLGQYNFTYTIQIGQLTEMPPTPQFSIKVNANATVGTLELKTTNDYKQGAQVIYTNGLTVKANTDYQVQVRSLQANFTSTSGSGNTIPLKTVKLLLIPAANNPATIFERLLSSNPQKIASGEATQELAVNFDISYSSDANDTNLINASMDTYSTTLQYEITPL